MSESVPIGDLLNSLGVTYQQEDGALISDALVILKVIREDGAVSLRLGWSDGMSWIERIGMLRTAEHIELADLPDSQPTD